MDWLTIPRADNFDICPDCYEAVFVNTAFKHAFVPAPLRGMDKPVSCDFGSSPWYRMAWLMTLKYRIQDARLLQGVAASSVKGQQCAGSRPAKRIWYSIQDPYARRPIPNFTVCHNCAKAVEVILPNLTGVFVPIDNPPVPTQGVCAMHFAPGRRRFVGVFDLMERTSDEALARKSPPNIQDLADRVRELLVYPECLQDEPVQDRKWFVMRSIPDFTVCQECFDQVVWPQQELDDVPRVVQDFSDRTQKLPMAACQLYSDRMRDVFKKACRRNDLGYFEKKIFERLDIESAIKTKLGQEPTPAETRELLKKWKEWE
jgi:hypothetical protein